MEHRLRCNVFLLGGKSAVTPAWSLLCARVEVIRPIAALQHGFCPAAKANCPGSLQT